jgi:DNA-binding NarL/FixJ family response regulator
MSWQRAPGDVSLTSRELEVLQLLAAGMRPKEIALELVISPKTVASHIQRVLAKLGAHSRAEAVAVAYRERLVSPLPGDSDGAVSGHILAVPAAT